MDNKKQVVLSIVGILILIGIVFGLTYAFWAYSRTGSDNNQITSGKILVNYSEGSNALDLADQYPMADSAGIQDQVFAFTVSGYIVGDDRISYTVYAVTGDEEVGRTRMRDYEVKMKLVASTNGTVPVETCISIKNNYGASYGNIVGEDNSLQETNSLILATGYISSQNEGVTETHTYQLKMWISEDIVTVGQTSSTTGTTSVYSSNDFENLYYSMKINVVASATK